MIGNDFNWFFRTIYSFFFFYYCFGDGHDLQLSSFGQTKSQKRSLLFNLGFPEFNFISFCGFSGV